ncbi:MAG TPA: asparaginase [Firmicutes bacterium]|jgi:L-asparaginase II|nr:asparaginase [Bacillota bacterium]
MSPELVHMYRGGLLDCIYRGDVAVVDALGNVQFWVGNVEKVAFLRSAAKPVQVLPVLTSGAIERFGIQPPEVAIMAASHSGEERHVAVVKGILDKLGLEPSHLQCGTHVPFLGPSPYAIYQRGEEPTALHNACSGKHCGMLALALQQGWDLIDYVDLGHPVQQQMLHAFAEVADMAGEEVEIGIDGCGVPVFGVTLRKMAYCYARLVMPERLPERWRAAARQITTAMTAHPEMVGGEARLCTDAMRVVGNGLIAKLGADGIYCFGIPQLGLGVAIKAEDGNLRAVEAAAVEVLAQLGVLDEKQLQDLSRYHRPQNYSCRGDVVGGIRPVFSLERSA